VWFVEQVSAEKRKTVGENAENHMNMLQQTLSRIAKYFKHESIKYAA
jgi:hypothetical protein